MLELIKYIACNDACNYFPHAAHDADLPSPGFPAMYAAFTLGSLIYFVIECVLFARYTFIFSFWYLELGLCCAVLPLALSDAVAFRRHNRHGTDQCTATTSGKRSSRICAELIVGVVALVSWSVRAERGHM